MNKLLMENRRSPLRLVLFFTSVVVMCFVFVPIAPAVTPAPDGGYGGENTAEGTNALLNLTTGVWNTAIGFQALKSNTTGRTNTATGHNALNANLSGVGNTAIGSQALSNNVTGNGNIAVGGNAGLNITTGSSNIDIGNSGAAADGKTIRIGVQGVHDHTFIAGISGVAIAGGLSVVVRTDGQLGIASISSARFKEEIKPMDKASEAILALKPVTFRYKSEIDSKGIPQFGLVAEDVEKVNPDLVTRDAEGKLYTVRYDQVNAMLLNEFLKEHRKVEAQEATITQLMATVAQQQKEFTARLREQDSKIEKVSAQLELNRLAPQVVLSNQVGANHANTRK